MSHVTRLIQPIRTGPAVARPGGIRSRVGWVFVLLTALAIVAYAAVPYFTASLTELAGRGVGLSPTYAEAAWLVQGALYVHIAGGAVALSAGPLQFWRGLRARAPRVHRWAGRAYLTGVALGATAAFVIAPSSPAGYVGFFGFSALALLWLVTSWRAYRAIRYGDVPAHRSWMIRSFALTYSAVTLRLWLPLLLFAPLLFGGTVDEASFANAYAAVPFLAWLPNLVCAEWLIRRRGLPSYRLPV